MPSACRFFALAALLPLLFAGCSSDPINKVYGRGDDGEGAESVNGTGVFERMFVGAGYKTTRVKGLSPRTNVGADVIVWFPDDYGVPGPGAVIWLESWLKARAGRTLIYVGRDYDAAIGYWTEAKKSTPPRLIPRANNYLTDAQADFNLKRNGRPTTTSGDWFTVDAAAKSYTVTTLQGSSAWTQGIDPTAARIELNDRFIPKEGQETLLQSNGDALVFRQRVSGSQLIVVTNGSFLLNASLVNKEHRKLAGRLIQECGSPGAAYFLQSDQSPTISDKDEPARIPNWQEVFTWWPIGFVLLHFAVLGIVFSFHGWPIFGMPRRVENKDRSDFWEHIAALGFLLSLRGNVTFARKLLDEYQRRFRQSGGAAAPEPRSSTPPAGSSPPAPASPNSPPSPLESPPFPTDDGQGPPPNSQAQG